MLRALAKIHFYRREAQKINEGYCPGIGVITLTTGDTNPTLRGEVMTEVMHIQDHVTSNI